MCDDFWVIVHRPRVIGMIIGVRPWSVVMWLLLAVVVRVATSAIAATCKLHKGFLRSELWRQFWDRHNLLIIVVTMCTVWLLTWGAGWATWLLVFMFFTLLAVDVFPLGATTLTPLRDELWITDKSTIITPFRDEFLCNFSGDFIVFLSRFWQWDLLDLKFL